MKSVLLTSAAALVVAAAVAASAISAPAPAPSIAAIPELYELNIGHAIIGRAAFDGLAKAVSDMRALMQEARQGI